MMHPLPRWALPITLTLFALLALAYSIVTPAFETPDEIWHYAFIHHLASGQGLPVSEPRTTALWQQQGTQSPGYYLIAAALTGWIDQSDFVALYGRMNPHAAIGALTPNGNINRMTHYAGDGWPWQGAFLGLHIARIFSIVLGVITLWASYQTVAPLLGQRTALLGTTILGFTPQFIFISAAASNDNLVNALAALVIWQLAMLLLAPPADAARPRRFALLGLFLGMAALSKLSALGLVGVAGLVVLGLAWHARSWRIVLDAALYIALPTALIAGWWFARNLLLYDDLLAWNIWEANILLRVTPASAATIAGELGSLGQSYWGKFGWLNLPYPEWVYTYFKAISLLIGAGAFASLIQHRRRLRQVDARWAVVAILFLWLLLLTISWLRFMIVAPAAQGRYFFPAAPMIVLLIGVGLAFWRRWRVDLAVALSLVMLALLTPPLLIAPAYASPPPVATLPAALTPQQVGFAEGITLVGLDAPTLTVLPGQTITVTAAWRADSPPSRDFSVFVHVVDHDGLIVAQLDTMPGRGLAPTSQWQAGDVYVDSYVVQIPRTTYTPNTARIAIGLYDAFALNQPRRRILADTKPQAGMIQEDALYAGEVTIALPPGQVPNQMWIPFGDNVMLLGYRFSQRTFRPGDTLTVTLYWQSRGPVGKEYTTFVHLLDTNFSMFGGHDGTPPTATNEWQPGAIIEDSHTFVVSPQTPAGTYQIELGLYDEEQDRLSLMDGMMDGTMDGTGAEGADRLLLGPLLVAE